MAYTKLLAEESTFNGESEIVMGMMSSWDMKVKEVQEVNEVKDFLKASHERGSPSRLSSTSFTSSKWGVAAAGGKRAAAVRGLLLAAHGGADQVLDGVGGRVIPLFRKRTAACPAGERGRCVGDGFLGVAHYHGRSRTPEFRIRF